MPQKQSDAKRVSLSRPAFVLMIVFVILTYELARYVVVSVTNHKKPTRAVEAAQVATVAPKAPELQDVIIGIVWGQHRKASVFVRAISMHAPNAHIVLLVPTQQDYDQKLQFQEFGAEIVLVPFPNDGDRQGNRFFLPLAYLKKNRHRFRKVILADVEDVVAQRDPFPDIPDNGVLFMMEHHRLPIGEDIWFDAKWVRNCFGQKELDRIGKFNISCAGVIGGSSEGIYNYLRAHTDLTINATKKCRDTFGFDQGIHIYIVYNEHVLSKYNINAIIHPYDDGIIYNMNLVPVEEFRYDQYGRILTMKGDMPALIHQFDRHWFPMFYVHMQYPFLENTDVAKGKPVYDYCAIAERMLCPLIGYCDMTGCITKPEGWSLTFD